MPLQIAKTPMPIALGAAMLLASASAQAQSAAAAGSGATDKRGYVTDVRNAVVRNATGLCWRTGYWTPALAIAECDPDLVRKTAAAAPERAAAPAPLPTPTAEKMTLAADTLFDFDKAVLRPQGREKLDELVQGSKNVNLELISAVGHTDRIGKDSYNQRLSEKRAQAVKAYLVSQGIDANRIQVEGRGEREPVTGDRCRNMGAESGRNRKLVDCLQPDRRVDVEVIGTRAAAGTQQQPSSQQQPSQQQQPTQQQPRPQSQTR